MRGYVEMTNLPNGFRIIKHDSCFNCKHYSERQTIELGHCIKYDLDVTYGFQHICDEFIDNSNEGEFNG